ncbi:MAG: glycogen synthase [Candidatus Eisenbacteria bacterium]|uniref:Glycogen synthase n=1 Tax=Eiseniibacteriota bacterium TaxID=2212470 RepID=A0A948RTL1_UNCEI|nr:glycogen synthase [Candidatus Eisenbacteria bacterium]MBU1947998.1 glycogen synthase [Candidatus Eisenbacteria bacterium]MBU2690645.1 glycogen synthase [Candidatus Eisenbacteria bacterium]
MAPYMKVGGLADVMGALPRELVRLGHQVAVAIPLYPGMDHERPAGFKILKEWSIGLTLGEERHSARVIHACETMSRVEILMVEHPGFYHRPNPYIDPETGKDWPDNALRFIFFCRAVEEVVRRDLWRAELVHLHDNHTAPLATFLARGIGPRPGIVLTIHNIGYQGMYPLGEVRRLGFPENWLYPAGPVEFWKQANFLKMGVTDSDVLTTVSPRYAKDIVSKEYGFGLEDLLQERAGDLVGILNGIDMEVWNPATDPMIPYPYRPSDFQNKRLNKERLLQAMELPVEMDIPIVGMVTRLVDQKGFDLIESAAKEMITGDRLKLIVLGTGEPRYEKLMRKLRTQYPQSIGVSIGFSEPMAHLVEAGSDFFLMPSLYEPCGLNQMYSYRYGTVPIVRATGGLADTVFEFEPISGRGTGFVFEPYKREAMLKAIQRAVDVYGKPRTFKKLVSKIMQLDYSWGQTALRYLDIYKQAIERSRAL